MTTINASGSASGLDCGTRKTLTGYAAITYAESRELRLSKYSDPIEEARDGLTVDEARDVAAEDPSLIYIVIVSE